MCVCTYVHTALHTSSFIHFSFKGACTLGAVPEAAATAVCADILHTVKGSVSLCVPGPWAVVTQAKQTL